MKASALAALLLVSGCSAPWGSHDLVQDRCADVVLLGLRGQGQSDSGHHGIGREVEGVVEAAAGRLHGRTTVRLQAVPYPARPEPTFAALQADVATGVRMVGRAAASVRAACPSTKVGLVGFSEGAEVAHLAASGIHQPWVVVLLMGDPVRNPGDRVRTLTFGTRPSGHGRDGNGPVFPAAVRDRVVQACAAGDNVCNAAAGSGAISATHRSFYEQSATATRLGGVVAQVASR